MKAGLRLDSISEDWVYPDMMWISSNQHTALLRAMSTSLSFHRWRRLLQQFGISLVSLAQSETAGGMPLAQVGWNANSFLSLLEYSFEPFQDYGATAGAMFCSIPDAVELWWSVSVERFRRGKLPFEAPHEHRFEKKNPPL